MTLPRLGTQLANDARAAGYKAVESTKTDEYHLTIIDPDNRDETLWSLMWVRSPRTGRWRKTFASNHWGVEDASVVHIRYNLGLDR